MHETTFNLQPSTDQPSTFNGSTFNLQPSTDQPSTFNGLTLAFRPPYANNRKVG
ncbi:MAG: hypothetical protein F6K56_35685 [Moorea sp. SIO3G5]|nr:hypothetical protein [Moorena sp. SIO3G5]